MESEMVVGGLFALGVDGICAVIDFTGVGAAVSPVIQGFAIFAIDRWVESKGGEALGLGKQFAQYAAGIIPLVPTITGTFAIRVFLHNHPTITEAAGKVLPVK